MHAPKREQGRTWDMKLIIRRSSEREIDELRMTGTTIQP